MKAVMFERFGGPLTVAQVADPVAADDGVVIQVQASGICRSDWHGWRGMIRISPACRTCPAMSWRGSS